MFEQQLKDLGFTGEATKAGNDWFKIKEGSQKVRILDVGKLYTQYFDPAKKKGFICIGEMYNCPSIKLGIKPSVKWLTWILDYEDGEIKLAKLSYSIAKQVEALTKDPEWTFDSMPAPYDITIKTKGAGTKEVEYSVVPSPKHVPVSAEVIAALAKKNSPESIVEKMKEKRIKEVNGDVVPTGSTEGPMKYPEEEVNIDNIPF